jgi:alpha-1,2-mannosyltransferase
MPTPADFGARPRDAWKHALFGIVPVLVTAWLVAEVLSGDFIAVDFRQAFFAAGMRTLHGADPYTWSRAQIAAGVSFPYPAVAALLFAPLAELPVGVASGVFTGLCLLAAPLALRLLDVPDWRLFGVVLLWSPVVVGWQTANVSLIILAGVALAWRWRDRPAAVGCLVALIVSVKPIMLPLGLWLLCARRMRALGCLAVAGIALNGVAWTVVGWSQVSRWLHLVSQQGDILYRKGYGLIALAVDAGGTRTAGMVLLATAAVALLAMTAVAARRRQERPLFALAVLLTIVISPQIDSHYFALLIAPLALAHRRMHAMWLLPLLLWVCPAAEANTWQAAVWWVVLLVLFLESLHRLAAPSEGPAETDLDSLSGRAREAPVLC